jgi:cysteinyl-tRNA synthetase
MRKRISDAEYFFIKKKYEDELSRHSVLRNHKKNFLSLDELRSKQKALERGLVDLKRHYREGLIIPEDYERQAKQVESEVDEVIEDIKLVQKETRESKSKKVPHISILSRIFSREEKVKGTEELVGEEEKQEKKEKEKRRRLLKRFASEK